MNGPWPTSIEDVILQERPTTSQCKHSNEYQAAFVLGTAQVALAHRVPAPPPTAAYTNAAALPMVQIMNMGSGICITGETALKALQAAIGYALSKIEDDASAR